MQYDLDRAAAAALIDTFVAGWNAADGARLASAFAQDADFTAVNGLRVRGRSLIGEGHDELFRTIFRDVTLASQVLSVRSLTPDVVAVEAELSYPTRDILPGVTRALAQYVATRSPAPSGDRWEIVIFRNMIPFERPVAGPVERRVREEMAP
jgi:uncharacterized protein (TIGR02246 family)